MRKIRSGAEKALHKIKIGGLQLFCMMFIFILGSTLLLDIGKAARQDAWIVPLLATFFGFVLYLVYMSLYK
ncbi:GerAB/ArcD/ProY family transporter, partial [Escherichia coli]|nr:GerAB/ArcD/ProY family transporter [Escherichia coli]